MPEQLRAALNSALAKEGRGVMGQREGCDGGWIRPRRGSRIGGRGAHCILSPLIEYIDIDTLT